MHARKSRLRKKFFVDSLKKSLEKLEEENKKLRAFIEQRLGADALPPPTADEDDAESSSGGPSLFLKDKSARREEKGRSVKEIEAPDYKLMHALHQSQQNFVVTDPYLPDNPVVFASSGFYKLTGFQPGEVIGRNCRFLQGPATDPEAVKAIRNGVKAGKDTTVCLINYKKDGTPFWNQVRLAHFRQGCQGSLTSLPCSCCHCCSPCLQFFVAPLRGVDGTIVNYVGVQSMVDHSVAKVRLSASLWALLAHSSSSTSSTSSSSSSSCV